MLTYLLIAALGTTAIQTTTQSYMCDRLEAGILEQFQESPYEVDISEACELDPAACTDFKDQCGGDL